MRACAVKVDDVVGVAGFALPGMHVDVLVTGVMPGEANAAGTKVRTLLQNIEVLSAGKNFQRDNEGKPVEVPVVNLLVTPDQAELLSLASTQARIQLVLRNPIDHQLSQPPGTDLANVLGRPTPKAPAPAPVVRRVVPVAPPILAAAPPPPSHVRSRSHERRKNDGTKIHLTGSGSMTTFLPQRLKRVSAAATVVCMLALSTGLPGLGLAQAPAQAPPVESPDDLSIAVGKSALVSSDQPIERVSVGFGEIAEATAVGPKELLVNAKAPGSTSMIVWQQGGGKLFFDVNVRPNEFVANNKLGNVRREIAKELPGQDITLSVENDAVFLRGTAKDPTSVDRAVAIASTLGKTVNLLYVNVPESAPQILLKVRFASIDRTASQQLGMNLFSTGAGNTPGSITTQQFPAPGLPQQGGSATNTPGSPFEFSNLLNIFLYRPDLNLGATIQALQTKGVLQILAEPNVLAADGKQASFLAGGEFPYPVAQGSALLGTVTIQFREYGVRLNFIPTVTARGTIRLQVAPEVSALDYSNEVVINGYNVPGLTTRKVNTEVELSEGQSFAIGGLLDKSVTDTFSKIPFIGDIPILGKFFQSKSTTRENTELVVIVTPELVHPIPKGAPVPNLDFPKPFMETSASVTQTPGAAITGTPAPTVKSVPFERYVDSLRPEKTLDPNVGTIKGTSTAIQQPNGTNEAPAFEPAAAPAPAPPPAPR